MSASKLVKPNVEYKDSYLEALDEFHAEGRYQFLDRKEVEKDFEKFINDLNEGRRHLHKPYADWVEPVPETILWLVKEDKYIGTFNIRHRLNLRVTFLNIAKQQARPVSRQFSVKDTNPKRVGRRKPCPASQN